MIERDWREREEMEVLHLGRYDDMTDTDGITLVSNCPSHEPRSVSSGGCGGFRQMQEQQDEAHTAGGCATAAAVEVARISASHQPITRPAVVFSANRKDLDSSSSSAVATASCTTSDFRVVEEELKELLSGYRLLVGVANGNHMRSEEATLTRKAAGAVGGGGGEGEGAAPVLHACVGNVPQADSTSGGDCNMQCHSITSLPVSSVHGDRSTEANTPTACVQMPQHVAHLRGGVNGESSETALCATASYATLPSAHVTTPVDLFADALTEDQISRSFEMQWQREQRMQLLQQHVPPGVPTLHVAPNSTNGAVVWGSSPLLDDTDASYPAMRREAGSPLPPFVNRRKFCSDRSRDMMTAKREMYDNCVSFAYRQQEDILSARGKPLVVYTSGSEGVLSRSVGVQCGTGALYCNMRLAEGARAEVSIKKAPPNGAPACSMGRHVRNSSSKLKQQQQTLVFRGAFCPLNREGDSTTPEIATSAQRTENPSMRSGATGGKKTASAVQRISMCNKHVTRDDLLSPTAGGGGGGGIGATKNNAWAAQAENVGVAASGPGDRDHCGPPTREYGRTRRHHNAATRFHVIVERRVAALEAGNDATVALPAFADSLVGAAISDFFPAVKRRQAQLKESQHAQAAAAAAMRY